MSAGATPNGGVVPAPRADRPPTPRAIAGWSAVRILILLAAALWSLGAAPLAAVCLGSAAIAYACRSPDRLLEAVYALAFCGIGYLAGR